jgi:diguanylate cyclase (GGDEF)-like protein/PAS domain S-box-containing protein
MSGALDAQTLAGHYRLLAEGTNDVVGTGDNDGRITWISDSVTTVLGWIPHDIVGRPFSEFVHPEDLPTVARAQQGAGAGERIRMDLRLQCADGSYRPMEILLAPIVDEDGAVVGRVAGWRDGLRRFEEKQALQARETAYRLIAENADDVVIRIGADLRIAWVSPSVLKLTGWSEGDLLGAPRWDLVHPQDVPHLRESTGAIASGSTNAVSWESRFRSGDGSYHWWSVSIRRMGESSPDGSDLVMTMRTIDDEVSARREAAQQIQRRIAILDSMLDPHVLLDAVRDESGAIVDFIYADANDAACAYNQLSREELVGASLMELLPGHRGAGLFDQYCHAVNTGVPLILDDFVYPHEILAEPRHFDIRGTKVGDSLSFTWRDVTERVEYAQQLTASEARFRLLAENASDVVLLTRNDMVEWISPSLSRMLGWRPEHWIQRGPEDFVHPDDVEAMRAWRQAVARAGVHRTRLKHRDGSYRWVEMRASLVPDPHGTDRETVCTFRTIEDVIARENELTRQAIIDDLTGTLKREEALRRLARIAASRRHPGAESAVVFCDVDHFKGINDSRGHVVGDVILRETARRIRGATRDSDLIARMGGDEFLVVLDGIHSIDEAVEVADKIRRAVEKPLTIGSDVLRVHLSAGVTLLQEGESPDVVIARADEAMYRAKASGRNAVVAAH